MIYVVTVFEKLIKDHFKTYIDYGYKRTIGYFTDKEDAIAIVKHNTFDIHEDCYNYAVIESIPEGAFTIGDFDYEAEYFKYDYYSDNYLPIPSDEATFHGAREIWSMG